MEPSDQAYTNEEQLIEDKFQELLNGYLNSNHRKKVEIIERAFKFAKEAHKGIRRRSGEPYILHPIAVARIVSQEIGLGSVMVPLFASAAFHQHSTMIMAVVAMAVLIAAAGLYSHLRRTELYLY